MIAIIDYGMGNLKSVFNAFKQASPEADIKVTSNPADIKKAHHVVFPGQGAMPDCIRELDERNLRSSVIDAAKTKPFLGICIGLQMLFDKSEEGNTDGLGLLSGTIKRFNNENTADEIGHKLKIPHMGWNEVSQKNDHPLWQNISNNDRFYFVHSYYLESKDKNIVSAETLYSQKFCCAIAKENIFAVQFHPEKSSTAGLQLIKNFVQWAV
jgi:glutamine amidotransferase